MRRRVSRLNVTMRERDMIVVSASQYAASKYDKRDGGLRRSMRTPVTCRSTWLTPRTLVQTLRRREAVAVRTNCG